MPPISTSSDLNTPAWIHLTPSGVVLLLLVQPSASRTEVVGPHGEPPRLKVRIAAPPVDGEANIEVIGFFAKLLKTPKSHISLVRGETSKRKDLLLRGAEMNDILAIIKGIF